MRRYRHSRTQAARAAANRSDRNPTLNDYAMQQLESDKAFLNAHEGWNSRMLYWLMRYWEGNCGQSQDEPGSREKAYEYVFVLNGGSDHPKTYLRGHYKREKQNDQKLRIMELETLEAMTPSETDQNP